jgi:hypothetical protein
MKKKKFYSQPYKQSFLKSHADAIAIVGVNIALITICVSLWISESHRIDAANARSDALHARSDLLHSEFCDLLKEGKK